MVGMSRSMTLILALIAGLLGGVVSSRFLSEQHAFAERTPHQQGFVITEGVMVLDPAGRLRATLGPSGDGGVVLSMLDSNGVPRLTAKASDKVTSLSLWDENGTLRTRLKAPESSLVFFSENGLPAWSSP
jgi:hypothetical protein